MNAGEVCMGKPNTLINQIVKTYLKLGHLHRDILDKEVRRTGVYRSQHRILMYLSVNSKASQKDIADFLEVSTATIAVTLSKLEKAGYIERTVDQADKRCNQIQLTKKGKEIVTQSHEIFHRVEEDMFQGFCDEEIKQLKTYFDRICRNLEERYKKTAEKTNTKQSKHHRNPCDCTSKNDREGDSK